MVNDGEPDPACLERDGVTTMDQRLSPSARNDAEHERLSALVDGECDAQEVARFTRQWGGDALLQQRWQTYHLIGDALRSDELARHHSGDAFMQGLRARLAQEPVVLAPTALRTPTRKARWLRPISAAAGVVAVAGTVWLLPMRQPIGEPQALASRSAPVVTAVAPAGLAGDRVVRKNGLDPYLSAHQQFQSAAAIAPMSGYLRHADYDATRH